MFRVKNREHFIIPICICNFLLYLLKVVSSNYTCPPHVHYGISIKISKFGHFANDVFVTLRILILQSN